MNNFWDRIILSNSIKDWTIMLSIILTSIIFLRFLQSVIIAKAKAYSSKTKTTIDDFIVAMIQSAVIPLLYIWAIYFGLKYIDMGTGVSNVLRVAMMLAATFFILRIITSFISFSFRQALKRQEENHQPEKQAKGILLIFR